MRGRPLDANEQLNIDIATKILGYEVEKCDPSWYSRTVFLFRRRGDDPRWIVYSFDTGSCNACMNRDQQDPHSSSAPPLPGYCYEISKAWEVIQAMRDRPEWLLFRMRLGREDLWELDEEALATKVCKLALATIGDDR